MIDIDVAVRRIGEEIAVSDWLEVTQERIDQFADATDDRQWIHVDPARAAIESPFKTTIAHGFLTLSLLSPLDPRSDAVHRPADGDQLRPRTASASSRRCPSGVAHPRADSHRAAVEEVGGGVQVTWQVTIEREHGDKPACVAEWLVRYYPEQA